jgi:hypothetical protein
VGCHNEFSETWQASGSKGFYIVPNRSLKQLFVFPVRMHWFQYPDSVKNKKSLEIIGLFSPERPIVVEDSDPLHRRDKRRSPLFRDLGDEFDDRFLRCTVVPRWQRTCPERSRGIGLGGSLLNQGWDESECGLEGENDSPH